MKNKIHPRHADNNDWQSVAAGLAAALAILIVAFITLVVMYTTNYQDLLNQIHEQNELRTEQLEEYQNALDENDQRYQEELDSVTDQYYNALGNAMYFEKWARSHGWTEDEQS